MRGPKTDNKPPVIENYDAPFQIMYRVGWCHPYL